MNTNKNTTQSPQQRTSDVITEKGMWVRFGVIPFYVRPITIAQTWEIAEDLKNLDRVGEEANAEPLNFLMGNVQNIQSLVDILPIIMFRSKLMRLIFRRYIIKRATYSKFADVVNYMAKMLDANFLITSIIFLKGLKKMTSPTTSETTVLGQ